jgi:hypothetical protein
LSLGSLLFPTVFFNMEKHNDITERLIALVENQTSFLSPLVHEIFIDQVQQTTKQNHVDNHVNWNMFTPMLLEDGIMYL